MARTGSLVTIGTAAFRCLVCGNRHFRDRPIKLNTTASTFLGLDWANRSSLGLVCCRCGYVHEFLGDQVGLWDEDHGYPDGTINAE
jgi:predicted nucleic-acid-binding Zn-ribbon protein